MRDMKIGPRLMAWFAVALFAGLAFGGLAYMKLTATSRVLEPRDGISNSTAFLSEDVRSGIQKEFSLLQQMLVTSDRGELERQMDAFLSERTRQANGFAQLEASISNEKLQTQLGTLKPARDAFGIAADNAVNLIRSGTDAGRQEAFQLEARTIQPAYQRFMEGSDVFVGASRRASLGAVQGSGVTDQRSAFFIYLACAIVIPLLVARFAIKSVTRPMAALNEVLVDVLNGDLAVRAEEEAADEIGQLSTVLNRHLDQMLNAAGCAERLADGDFNVHITAQSDRDIMGRAFARMRSSLQNIQEMTDRMLEGDYVQPRITVENNRLGVGLVRLRDVLRATSEAGRKIAEGELAVPLTASKGNLLGSSLLQVQDNWQVVTDFAKCLAAGDLNTAAYVPLQKDGLGLSLIAIREYMRYSATLIEQLAAGDFSTPVSVGSEADVLGHAIAGLQVRIGNLVTETTALASNLLIDIEQLTISAEQLKQRSAQQGSLSTRTTALMDSLASSLRSHSNRSGETDQLAALATNAGESGGQALGQLIEIVRDVRERIELMHEITRKTDLLTLSAAVEAARAGEHGLGFSVVTAELRKLGERNQAAASEMMRLTSNGMRTAESADQFLAKTMPTLGKAAHLVREMALIQSQQSSEASRAGEALLQLDKFVRQNQSSAEELSLSARLLMQQAETLRTTVENFGIREFEQEPVSTSEVAEFALQKGAAG